MSFWVINQAGAYHRLQQYVPGLAFRFEQHHQYSESLQRQRSRIKTTGNYNTTHGYQAGLNNTTGSNNFFLDSYSNASKSNLSNAAAIGFRA